MRILIASDLHGSAYYTRLLLQQDTALSPDRLVLLGDLLYHGPRNDLPRDYAPKEVIELLSPLADRILCVRGNCEAEVDQMVLPFPVLADYGWLVLGSRTAYLTHGHTVNAEHPIPFAAGSLLLMGHTHVPERRDCGTFTVLNPGSVSIPKAGSRHSFLLCEDGVFTWRDVETGEIYDSWQA